MKSWLRQLANRFSRKPEPTAETTWHAEDFRAAPDRILWYYEANLEIAEQRGVPDAILIPLQCEYYALEGLSQLLGTVQRVQDTLNPALDVDSVLLTMYDARLNLSRQVAADARAHFGDKVFETVVPRNIRLAEAPSFGKPIVVYDVASVGAQAYMAVARELIDRTARAAESTQQQ